MISKYSQLSPNGQPYKTNTSIKRTPGVGPCLPFFSHFAASKLSIYKLDTSIRRTVGVGPDGIHLRESWL